MFYIVDLDTNVDLDKYLDTSETINIKRVDANGFKDIIDATKHWSSIVMKNYETKLADNIKKQNKIAVVRNKIYEYSDLNQTLLKNNYKFKNGEINKADYDKITNELTEKGQLLEKDVKESVNVDIKNNAQSVDSKLKNAESKLKTEYDTITNIIENIIPTIILRPKEYEKIFMDMIENIKNKELIENELFYHKCENYFKNEFKEYNVFIIDNKNDTCLYIYDKTNNIYFEMMYDYNQKEITYSKYDELEKDASNTTLFIKILTYRSQNPKMSLIHNANDYKYGYNNIIDKIKDILDKHAFSRYMIRLIYYFRYNEELVNYICSSERLIYGYGIELLRIYHKNEKIMEIFMKSIIKPRTIFCSFRDSGDNVESARNNLYTLEYSTIEDDISKINNGTYNLDRYYFNSNKNFPNKTHYNIESIKKETIKLDLIKDYIVLGRTIFKAEVYDDNKYEALIKQNVRNTEEEDYIELGNCFKKLTTNGNHKEINAVYFKAYKLKKQGEIIDTLLYEIDVINWLAENLGLLFPMLRYNEKKIVQITYENDSNEIIQKLKQAEKKGRFSIDQTLIGVEYYVISNHKNNCNVTTNYIKYLENCLLGTADCKIDDYILYFMRNIVQSAELLNKNLIHSSLVNMYHNFEHARIYLMSADILNLQIHRFGVGRLNTYLEAAKYSNIRYSGLADYAEIMPKEKFQEYIRDEINKTNSVSNYLNLSIHDERILEFEMLANQILSFYIVLTRSIYQLSVHKNTITKKKFLEIRNVFKSGIKTFFSKYLNLVNEKDIDLFFEKCGVTDDDYNKIIQQLMYFLYYDYVNDLSQNNIKKDIYDDNTQFLYPDTLSLYDIKRRLSNGESWNDIAEGIARGWVQIVLIDNNGSPNGVIHLGWIYSLSNNSELVKIIEQSLNIKFSEESIIHPDKGTLLLLNYIKYWSEFIIKDTDKLENNLLNIDCMDTIRETFWIGTVEYMDAGPVNGSLPFQNLIKIIYSLVPYSILKKYENIDPDLSRNNTLKNIKTNKLVQMHLDLLNIIDSIDNDTYTNNEKEKLNDISNEIENLRLNHKNNDPIMRALLNCLTCISKINIEPHIVT